MKSIRDFYLNDRETADNVKAFMIQVLEEIAVKRVFSKENTDGLADAKVVIDTAFAMMENMVNDKQRPKTDNEAR